MVFREGDERVDSYTFTSIGIQLTYDVQVTVRYNVGTMFKHVVQMTNHTYNVIDSEKIF